MIITNITNYVRAGCEPIPDDKFFRQGILGPCFLTLLGGLYPGLVLKGPYLSIAFWLILINVISTIAVYKMAAYGITHKVCLKLKSVMCLAWVIELSLLEVMYFSLWRGFRISVLLLFTPIVLIPLIMGFVYHKNMKKPAKSSSKGSAGSKIGKIGGGCGIASYLLAKALFKDVEQSTAIIAVLICITLINSIMSIGLLNIQRLYYMHKYNITFETTKSNTIE